MVILKVGILLVGFITFIKSDVCTWNNCPKWSPDPKIWNIHFIPHSHDDLGWLKTADQYYTSEVRYIFNTMTYELEKDPNKKFSYCETGYLKRWIQENPDGVDTLKKLIQNGQLEIIGGGWVQPDEAAPHYIELIDQYTLGLRIMNESFGPCAVPRVAWQIDPFGHSREHANLMRLMGYESLWFARNHYLDYEKRWNNKEMQMMWHTTDENTPDNTILTGIFSERFSAYSAPLGFMFDIRYNDEPIQDNPSLENYNLDERLSTFMNYLKNHSLSQQHNHFMILYGGDFNYQDANMDFVNIDKLIKYLNLNYSSVVNAFYSTPTCYTMAIKNISSIQWPEKYDDFFPYASDPHAYWTGYFTSKPTMKGLVRKSSSLLQLIRQLQSLALTTWSDQVGKQIETLERSVSLSQHHDAVTGTSKEFVTQDYIYRMIKGWTAVEKVLNNAMQTISQRVKNNQVSLPSQIICRNINESECVFIRGNNIYTVTVHNGNAQPLNSLVKIPLYQNPNNISVSDGNGNQISFQILNVFNNPGQINNTNMAPFEIAFMANVDPIGFKTYFLVIQPGSNTQVEQKSSQNAATLATNSMSNGIIQLDFDSQGYLSAFHDLTTGKTYPLKQEFMYYHGADRHNQRASGAYVFRPVPNSPYKFSGPINLNIINGSIVQEARQIISPWVSQVIRLVPNKTYVEFEWTIGPIPADYNISKEIITTYTMNDLKTNGTFWTDANGRQMMKRIRNYYPSFTYNNTEPISGNYYPIDTRILLADGTTSLAILTDRSHGGSSMNDGQVEIMLHRRDFYDDGFGVAEPLNEPGRDGRGLVARGKHWLVLGNTSYVTRLHRTLAYELFHEPVLTFSNNSSSDDYKKNFVSEFSGLLKPLSPNINLLTLKQLDSNNVLIRLEHIFQKSEDLTLSQPVTVDLSSIIPSYKIAQIQELSLAANKVLNPNVNGTITLNHMDIRTFQLTTQANNLSSQTSTIGSTPITTTHLTKSASTTKIDMLLILVVLYNLCAFITLLL